MTDDQKIIDKIKKCLALAKSSNPNEAATALRQAHALMEKHGISTHEVSMSDIGESTADMKTMSREKPAAWESHLAYIVAKCFGCRLLVKRKIYKFGAKKKNSGAYIFIGLRHQSEIAAYTAEVLIRKCKSARQKFLSENFKGASVGVKGAKAEITRLGDRFAEGWVISIEKLVVAFANPPEVQEAIDRHLNELSPGSEAPARSTTGFNAAHKFAIQKGFQAAQGESIHKPMNDSEPQKQIAGQ